ncbi:CotH kinase family protein [Peloplasma aerotolerans]|uniref:CotH kinase family protein n=1 Tax=Peloplasma aerotolerans TaxID=3044389 RepID=A0AAW6U9I0_9MOLU|nr:CotH kinase family protein [Mariniplasma sp. M4Ah]MDI6453365.1 CotH kinase family protein [Mariniplasma sp. M4Ah]
MKKILIILNLCLISIPLFFISLQQVYAVDEPNVLSQHNLNPTFSHQSGFYDEAFYLEIYPKPNTIVFYTLDSSTPDFNSTQYVEPILIEEQWIEATGDEVLIQREIDGPSVIPVPQYPISMIRTGSQRWISPREDIFKATVIKVIAYDYEQNESSVLTNSYFVTNNASEKYSFPVISISTDIHHLFDYETGIHIPGIHYDPTISEVDNSNRTGNYYQTGQEWEKPVFIEYFDENGSLQFSQNAGLRIHGSLSRKYPLKSYRLYARNEYDDQGMFNYQFFDTKELNTFKRIILRNGGQTYQYSFFGEAAAQALLEPLSLDIQYSKPVILFLNGEYFGIRNLRDRYDDWYLETHYGVDRDDVTILTGHAVVQDGSSKGSVHYQSMYSYATRRDMSIHNNYEYIKTQMDVDNFIDYYIAELYFGNVDWPQNNVMYWRKNVAYNQDAPYGHDGRWRWLVVDIDAGFGASWGGYYPEINSFERITGDSWKTGKLFTSLLENNQFKAKFIYRFIDLLSTTFSAEVAAELVQDMINLYAPEMQDHIDRWGYPTSYNTWMIYANRVLTFAQNRPENVYQHLLEHYDLDQTYQLTIDVDETFGHIQVNSLVIPETSFPYQTSVFDGLPVTLKALPKPGYRFVGWFNHDQHIMSSRKEIILPLYEDLNLVAAFEEGEEIDEGTQPLMYTNFIIYSSIFTLGSVSILVYLLYDTKKRKLFPFHRS